MWPFEILAKISSQETLKHVELEYSSLTKTLREKLTIDKTLDNLKVVSDFQQALSSMTDHVMKFSDFFTAERVESIWDLLHESREYLTGSNYEQIATGRCRAFANRYVSGEKARQALLNLHSILPDAEYKEHLAETLCL